MKEERNKEREREKNHFEFFEEGKRKIICTWLKVLSYEDEDNEKEKKMVYVVNNAETLHIQNEGKRFQT